MFYDIYLRGISDQTKYNPASIELLARLSQENAGYVLQKQFPVIVCRYATVEEKNFYIEFGQKHGLDIYGKKVDETVFDAFNSEIKRNEQMDSHLMPKPVIKELLQSGAEVLRSKEKHKEKFFSASEMIRSMIQKQTEMSTAKFSPKSIYVSFIMWLLFASMLFLMAVENCLLIAGCAFIGIMGLSILGDYIVYQKEIGKYFSSESEQQFWDTLISNNATKNLSIHAVEDFVDTLTARKCLTVLPASKRELEEVETLLEKIDELSTAELLEEID